MPEPASASSPAADLDRRFYAFTIDRAVAWTIDLAAAVVIYLLVIDPGHLWAGVAAIAGVVVLVGLVLAVVLGVSGTSPGLAATGLRVVRDGTGAPIGTGPAVLRQLVLGVATLPTLGLGVATLAWTALADPTGRRRGWHDHLAHSVVVDVRPVPEELPEPVVAPHGVVNLTAMRLVPVPAGRPVTPPARTSATGPPPPPPAPLEEAPLPKHAAVGTDTLPPPPPPPPPVAPPAPLADPTPTSPRAATQRQQKLGYPLLPEPSPESAAPVRGGAHAARGVPPEHAPEPAAVPPRWRVSFDSGETFLVDGLALVGRRPEGRHGEQVEHLVSLRSDDMSLSKTHAQFQIAADGALVVMDRGSTNGSFLVRQGVPRGLPAGKAATLVDGDHVRFGDRQMTVEREA